MNTAKKTKLALYSLAATAAVIIIAILVILLAELLPASLRRIDMSPQKITEISKETVTFLKGLKSRVDIYYISVSGNEDTQIRTFINKYEEIGSNIKVTSIDPVVRPNFIAETTFNEYKELYDNSLIIKSASDSSRYKVVEYSSLYTVDILYNI